MRRYREKTVMATIVTDRKRWIALGVVVAAQFMVVLDVAIVNVALPSIRSDLHFTQESLQWIVTAYSIMFGGVLLLGGRMGDLMGRRRLFMAGIALFTISSLSAGLAWSEASLITFRALHGLGAAALGITFFVVELRSKAPLLPLRLFRLPTLRAANVTGLLNGAAAFSQFFLLTLYMQEVLHYSALKTGVAYLTMTLAIIVFANVAQGLVTRIGVRRVLPVGLAMSAAALILLARLPEDGHYFWDLFPGFLLSGIGLALAFVPMT